MNSVGKVMMECVIETKASTILQFIDGLRGDVRVTLEEGTWTAWLYDLLKPRVTEIVVCNPRKTATEATVAGRTSASGSRCRPVFDPYGHCAVVCGLP
jgi:hypothetical protein